MIKLILLVIALVLFALGAFETYMFDMNWFDQAMAGFFFFAASFLPFPDFAIPARPVRKE